MNSEYSVAHVRQGDIYKDSGSINLAISEYQKALKIDSTNTDAFFKLGQIYEMKGESENEQSFFILAKSAYEKATAVDINNLEIHNSIVSLAARHGWIDDIVKQYKEKLVKNPNNPVLIETIKKIAAISLVTIPSRNICEKSVYAKMFLNNIFGFSGLFFMFLGVVVPTLKILRLVGVVIFTTVLIYKLSPTRQTKYRKW